MVDDLILYNKHKKQSNSLEKQMHIKTLDEIKIELIR